MPELAEVETVRHQIETQMKGRKITDVIVDNADRFLFEFTKIADFKKALQNTRVLGAGRKGKYFWLELNRKPWPIFHLGMTGNIALLNPKSKSKGAGHEKIWGGAKLWSEHNQDLRERMLLCRMLLKADKNFELALIDPRRFGRVWLSDDPENHPRIKKLGYDPLLNFPSANVIGARLVKRKKAIKSVLQDQTLFAGVGNWLADEILYQARLSPHRLASELNSTQVKTLHKSILQVVRKAVSLNADYSRFPKTWLFHNRWGKVKTAKTSHGPIQHEEIGGRTTAWVPGWQK